ncbi:MAG: DUF6363 domain-containing protein [Dysosmobacter sp.]
MFPVIHLDGQPYLDGGCADAIPWRHALEEGCDRVVVILTRERSYSKRPSSVQQRLLARRFRRYPKFVETMARRAEAYNQSRQDLFAMEGSGKVLILEPESTAGFSRTERDVEKIRRPVAVRLLRGHRALEEVRAFWDGPTLRRPLLPGSFSFQSGQGVAFHPADHGLFAVYRHLQQILLFSSFPPSQASFLHI